MTYMEKFEETKATIAAKRGIPPELPEMPPDPAPVRALPPDVTADPKVARMITRWRGLCAEARKSWLAGHELSQRWTDRRGELQQLSAEIERLAARIRRMSEHSGERPHHERHLEMLRRDHAALEAEQTDMRTRADRDLAAAQTFAHLARRGREYLLDLGVSERQIPEPLLAGEWIRN